MRVVLLVPLVYAAAVADTALAEALRIGRVAPSFSALAAMLWLLVIGRPGSFLGAGIFGLVEDLIAPGRIGLGLAGFLLGGCCVARLRARFAPEHFLWQVAITWGAVTLLALIAATGRWLLGEVPIGLWAALQRAAGVGLYTAGVSVPVFMILGWLREPWARFKVQGSGFRNE